MNVHNDALQAAVAEVELADNPTEQVEADIDNSADELNASSEELGSISRQVEKTGDMVASLENFMDGFMSRVPEGEWTPAIARQYRVGISSLMSAHGYAVDPDKISASFEDAGVKQTNDENRTENKEKTQGVISKLYEALKAALIAMGAAIKRFAGGLINNAKVLEQAGRNLQSQAGTLKSDPTNTKFRSDQKWISYYQKSDRTEPTSPSSLIADAAREINTLLGNWDASFKKQLANPGDEAGAASGQAIITLAGGRTIYAKNLNEELKGGGKSLAEASLRTARMGEPAYDMPFLSREEIQKIGKEMVANASFMRTMADSSKSMQTELTKVLDKLKADNKDGKAKEHFELARKLVGKFPVGIQVLAPLVASISLDAWRHALASISMAAKDQARK